MLETVLEPGTTELELAQRYAASVHEVMPLVGPMIVQMLSQHLRNMVQGEMVGQAERLSGRLPGARDQAVGFADLVGFTRLGEEIAPEDLGSVAERLFSITREVVDPPVRLVKTIGDAVLLTAADPDDLVATALALVHATDAESADGAFPQVRVGLAYGPTVARGGDVFGRAVNLASRVTAIARAGSVLATREVRDGARDAFHWSSAHARRIKGLPDPLPRYRARPARERPDRRHRQAAQRRHDADRAHGRERLVDADRLADRARDDHPQRHHAHAGHVVVARDARERRWGCAPAARSPTA